MVPILILLYLGFRKIDNNAHKLYLRHEDKEIEEIQEKEDRWVFKILVYRIPVR